MANVRTNAGDNSNVNNKDFGKIAASAKEDAATRNDFYKLRSSVNSAMNELQGLRGKAEIPAWERKEMKEARALERAKANAVNKIKAQGPAINSSSTSGFNKTKPKGK